MTLNDPANCKALNANKREWIVLKGPPPTPKRYSSDKSGRTQAVFILIQINGESVNRNWLVWREEAASVFCFPSTSFKCYDDIQQMYKSQLRQGRINDK